MCICHELQSVSVSIHADVKCIAHFDYVLFDPHGQGDAVVPVISV